MYSKGNLIYILTILEAIEKIFIYSSEFESADAFFQANDQLNYNASNNLLLAIGEESKKIDSQLKNEFDNIPWVQIAGSIFKIRMVYLPVSQDCNEPRNT